VRHQRWRTLQAATAGAVSAAIIVFAGIAATPSPTPEVADTPVTTVAPTVPPPQPEVVPPIVATTTTEGPAETTTTTTEAPPVVTTSTVPPDTTPPPLDITSPKPDEHFEVDLIDFRGTTEPGATVFAGQYEATVDGEGNWSIRLVLSPGANGARFIATDAAGNQTEARVTVHFDVPEATTEPPKDPPKDIEFTAHSVYGSCAETPPFDVYWGTASPGTPVYIESEFGSGATEANANGDWEVKVFFPEAPADKVFSVKVRDNKGNKKFFEFVHFV